MAWIERRWRITFPGPDGARRSRTFDRQADAEAFAARTPGARMPPRPNVWRACYRDPEGSKRRRTFARRADAERHLTLIEADKLRGSYLDPAPGRETLAAFWRRYERTTLAQRRASTRASYEVMWRRHIGPHLGAVRLSSLSRQDVEDWIGTLAGSDVRPPTIRAAYRVLRALLAVAEKGGLIARNAARGVPTPAPARRRMRILTAEELEAAARAVPERYRALVLLLGYGGLRIGEALALTVDDLDLLRARVHVTKAATEVRGAVVVGETKTEAGRRSVPIPRRIAEELASHLEAHPPAPEGLVFTTEGGDLIRRTNWRARVWIGALRAAAIAEPLPRVHDLRHTAADLAIKAGAHPKVIQEMLGHSSIVVTLDTYGHRLPPLEEGLADRLDVVARAAASSGAPQVPPEGSGVVVAMPARPGESTA